MGKLAEAWRIPNSCNGAVGSRDGSKTLPTSMIKWFSSLVTGFAFTSREYILQNLPMTASET